MTEPRARAARHKGQLNFEQECKFRLPWHVINVSLLLALELTVPYCVVRQFLYAFGDDKDPLPETVRVLDEIVTDYIIETCHVAARSADVTGRQKIKVDDFRFAIRNDEMATGRVKELLQIDKELKDSRKQFDTHEGKVGLERGGRKKKGEDVDMADVPTKDVGKDLDGDIGEDDVDVD